nr:hypothetical protein [Klebsiella pneumoniae]
RRSAPPDGSLIYLIDAGEAIYERDFHLRDGVTVKRRSRRSAPPDGSLIYLIDAGEAIYERDFHLRDGVTV